MTKIFLVAFFSLAGLIYIIYGRKNGNLVMAVCGIVLSVIPYFIGNTLALAISGVVLCILPYLVKS